MVAADAGESFGDLTTKYLGRLKKERGTMIAVCTKHYGEMTASAYSSHKDRSPLYNFWVVKKNTIYNELGFVDWEPYKTVRS